MRRLEWIHVATCVDPLMFDELARSEVVAADALGVLHRPIAEFVLGT